MQAKIAPAARALADLTFSNAEPARLEAHIAALAAGLDRALPASGELPLAPLDWLKLAAESLSLHVELIEASRDELAEWLRWDEALLTALERRSETGEAHTQWLLVRTRGGRVTITSRSEDQTDSTREVEFDELAELCAFEGARRLRWLKARVAVLSERDEERAAGSGHSPAADATPLTPLKRLWKLVEPDRGDIAAVGVFAVAIGVLSLATPVAVQALVNFVALGGALQPLLVVLALLFLGLCFAGVLSALQTWVVEMLQRRLLVRVLADLTARLPRMSVSVRERHEPAELVNRFLDVIAIQKLGSFLLLDGLSILLSAFVGLVVLAFYHPLLLAFDVVLLLSIALIVFGPARHGMKTAKAESHAKFELLAWLEELARNPVLYKSSGALRLVFERSDRLARIFLEHRAAHFRVVFSHYIGTYVLQILASTALLGVGGLLVMEGSLTLGQLVAAELIVTLVVSSVAKLGKHLESFYDLVAATDKLGMLLDLPVEHQGGEHHLLAVEARGAELELRGVTCASPGGAGLEHPLDMRVRAGERLGLGGPSGGAKRTIAELIWGLRAPSSGVVRIDGRDLRTLSLESLRRSVALLDQPEVLAGTVRENVRVARPYVTDDDVQQVLHRLGLTAEIEDLSDGVETLLRSDGRPLSRGQVLRLQVARAVAGRPRLVLVNEALDELSDEQREALLDLLFDRSAPWTLVVASQRAEILARCDRVLRLSDGALGEGGPQSPRN